MLSPARLVHHLPAPSFRLPAQVGPNCLLKASPGSASHHGAFPQCPHASPALSASCLNIFHWWGGQGPASHKLLGVPQPCTPPPSHSGHMCEICLKMMVLSKSTTFSDSYQDLTRLHTFSPERKYGGETSEPYRNTRRKEKCQRHRVGAGSEFPGWRT